MNHSHDSEARLEVALRSNGALKRHLAAAEAKLAQREAEVEDLKYEVQRLKAGAEPPQPVLDPDALEASLHRVLDDRLGPRATAAEPVASYEAAPRARKLSPDAQREFYGRCAARARCFRRSLSDDARHRAIIEAKRLGAVPDEFSSSDVFETWRQQDERAGQAALATDVGRVDFFCRFPDHVPPRGIRRNAWLLMRLARLHPPARAGTAEVEKLWDAVRGRGCDQIRPGMRALRYPGGNVAADQQGLYYSSGDGASDVEQAILSYPGDHEPARWPPALNYPGDVRATYGLRVWLPNGRELRDEEGNWLDARGRTTSLPGILTELDGTLDDATTEICEAGLERLQNLADQEEDEDQEDAQQLLGLAVAELLATPRPTQR